MIELIGKYTTAKIYADTIEDGVFSRYFGDLVKQATGASAKEYIQSYIIRLAKNILMSGRSISETAYMLGFDYPHHFTRMFKNKTGITPSEYMRGQSS